MLKKLLTFMTCLLFLSSITSAAITYFGSASTPADNGSNVGNPVIVTPPGSMLTGDIVILCVQSTWTSSGQAITISEAGGQSWNTGTQINQETFYHGRMFWCEFDGVWDANPSATVVGTTCDSAVMHVFRPGSGDFDLDVAEVVAGYAAPDDPFTVTITGITTNTNGALVFAWWGSTDDNTWDTLTGGWTTPGSAQYRNTASSDGSLTHAYQIKETAGATGNVSKNQATNGGDYGGRFIIAFKEVGGNGAPTENAIFYGANFGGKE